MRLLCTSTIQLLNRDVISSEDYDYAILSHTWGDNEFTFADLTNLTEETRSTDGYRKIANFCKQAAKDGYESNQLNVLVVSGCKGLYVYLFDVTSAKPKPNEGNVTLQMELSECRWLKRGWTLQELLAPSDVRFFNFAWDYIGSKATLQKTLSQLTGIDKNTLCSADYLPFNSVARRMSWAATRQTTRIEDRAYSLLGIFGVNMPLLYGEGPRAFQRLQHEIMAVSDDQSLFAWGLPGTTPDLSRIHFKESMPLHGSILADSPSLFANSEDIIPTIDRNKSTPFSFTNRGLVIEMALVVTSADGNSYNRRLYGLLDCQKASHPDHFVAINLTKREEDGSFQRMRKDVYGRGQTSITATECIRFDLVEKITLKTIAIRGSHQLVSYEYQQQTHVTINHRSADLHGFKIIEVLDMHSERSIQWTQDQKVAFSLLNNEPAIMYWKSEELRSHLLIMVAPLGLEKRTFVKHFFLSDSESEQFVLKNREAIMAEQLALRSRESKPSELIPRGRDSRLTDYSSSETVLDNSTIITTTSTRLNVSNRAILSLDLQFIELRDD